MLSFTSIELLKTGVRSSVANVLQVAEQHLMMQQEFHERLSVWKALLLERHSKCPVDAISGESRFRKWALDTRLT